MIGHRNPVPCQETVCLLSKETMRVEIEVVEGRVQKSYFQAFIEHDINLEILRQAIQAMPPSRGNTIETQKAGQTYSNLIVLNSKKGTS